MIDKTYSVISEKINIYHNKYKNEVSGSLDAFTAEQISNKNSLISIEEMSLNCAPAGHTFSNLSTRGDELSVYSR